MKRLHLICTQQRGQIDGSFWRIRHDSYFSEYFGEVELPRGGPSTKGSVRGSNCHSSLCGLLELYLSVSHIFFYRNDLKMRTVRNKKRVYGYTLQNHGKKEISCGHKLPGLARLNFGFLRSALFSCAQNAGKACSSNTPSAFQLNEFLFRFRKILLRFCGHNYILSPRWVMLKIEMLQKKG